jgi:hypothetical protein
VSEFEINLPYRSRQDPLDIEALNAASERLEGDDRAVAERLIWAGMIDPKLQTVGDLWDRIEQASPEERRRIADEARSEAGLTTFTEIAENRRLARERRDDPPKLPTAGPTIQKCPDCEAVSSTPEGALRPTLEKRWHCDRHRHLAEDGDLDPLESEPLRFAPGGGMALPVAEEEAAARHYERVARESRERARKRQEQNQREHEALDQVRERYVEEADPINFAGFRIRPDGRIVNE